MTNQGARGDRFVEAVLESRKRAPLSRRAKRRIERLLPESMRGLLERRTEVTREIERFARSATDVTFVQVGACDGVTGDPLYPHITRRGWSGVVVEPVPFNYARLRENYLGHPRVVCENVAISDRNEVRKFFFIDTSRAQLPVWCAQIGSFDRSHLEKHAILMPEIESFITEMDVECITMHELFTRHGLDSVDVIHTDAEGFDLNILRQIQFDRPPLLVLYEDLHMSDRDRNEAATLFREHGYEVIYDGMNACARLSRPSQTPSRLGELERAFEGFGRFLGA